MVHYQRNAVTTEENVIEIESNEGVLVLNGNKAKLVNTNSLSVTKSITKSSAKLRKKMDEDLIDIFGCTIFLFK